MPRICQILNSFKEFCKIHGWKISENEDWIKVNDKYHNFLWIRNIHLSSFRSILANRKCIVREGLSYRVIEASYTAWLLSEKPLKILVKEISENPTLHNRVALYDLSPILEGKNLCMKMNYTDSLVFQEFENFLKDQLKVKLKTLLNPRSKHKNYVVL